MTSVLPPARRTRPPNRRELILAAATELFAVRGYEYVGMSEIAEEVAVQPSALYRHFAGKEQLLAEILREAAASLLAAAEKFIADGDNTYGGRVVTNPSGGLLSKGHPLGATGLAQCAELVWQLRGEAGARQVDDVSVALQHNIGLGGAAVITLYEKVS